MWFAFSLYYWSTTGRAQQPTYSQDIFHPPLIQRPPSKQNGEPIHSTPPPIALFLIHHMQRRPRQSRPRTQTPIPRRRSRVVDALHVLPGLQPLLPAAEAAGLGGDLRADPLAQAGDAVAVAALVRAFAGTSHEELLAEDALALDTGCVERMVGAHGVGVGLRPLRFACVGCAVL